MLIENKSKADQTHVDPAHRLLAGGGSHGDEHTGIGYIDEILLVKIFISVHVACFATGCLNFLYRDSEKWLAFRKMMDIFTGTCLYVFMIIYCIYELKILQDHNRFQYGTEIILNFEFNFFICKMISTMIFIAYLQLFKFNSFWRETIVTRKSEYIWKSKNTTDCLQYWKYENELFDLNGMLIVYYLFKLNAMYQIIPYESLIDHYHTLSTLKIVQMCF